MRMSIRVHQSRSGLALHLRDVVKIAVLMAISLVASARPACILFANDEQIEQSELFVSGEDGDKASRIPSLIATSDGAVQAFCEEKAPAPEKGTLDTGARPNILLIVSEDNGPELGCYGDPYVQTPVLDQLAADGIRFHNAYAAQAGCSQSRAAILTGLYPHQNGQIGLATWKFRMYREDTPNVVRRLKSVGYRTGIVGKLHINPATAFPFDVKEHSSSNFSRNQLGDYAKHAADFFNASNEPFFLSVNYPDAHRPFTKQVGRLPAKPLTAGDVKPLAYFGLDTPQLREETANYYNCMSRLDSLIGDLLEALDKSGKAKNTLVVYLGDHGADMLRGKRTSYEGGVRIPLVIKWPRKSKAGQVRHELVSTLDLMPTLLATAGAKPVANLPGRSLLPMLRGETPEWREYLFTEFHLHSAHNFYPQRTVRDARYKLIQNLMPGEINPGYEFTLNRFYADLRSTIQSAPDHVCRSYRRMKRPPEFELYDLQNDPHEFRDLADDAKHAVVLDDLKASLAKWRAQTADPLLDVDKITRLKNEIDACMVGGSAQKAKLKLTYPEYFFTALVDKEDRLLEGDVEPFLGKPRFDVRPVFKEQRFPNIVVSTKGTLLATFGRDSVRLRRSEDGGKTWSDEVFIGQGYCGGGTTVDETTGHIFAFVEARHPPAPLTTYRSKDDGRTWEVAEVTIHPDSKGHTPSMHMNEHGITLRHGKHKGRLLRPSRYYGKANKPEIYPTHFTNAIYSDDHGKTWHTSDPFPENGTGEAAVAELSDGRIYYNTRRHWAPADKNPLRRWHGWSDDGGATWKDVSICQVLPDGSQDTNYGCMGGLVRLPINGKDILIYSNCDSPSGRKLGTVWASFDGGKTWPLKRLVQKGKFAYSSLNAGRPGTASEGWIYLHFESEGSKIARFNLSWILQGEKTGNGTIPASFALRMTRKAEATTAKPPNVLFVSVDDMKDWVNCLGGYEGTVYTPNIDRLAKRGMLFTNAHCASPKCAPSRTAILTGMRPSTTGLYDNGHWWLPNLPDVVTIPMHFRRHGYHVVGAGKIFHHTAGNHPPNQWDTFHRLTFNEDPWFRGAKLNYPWSLHEPYPKGFPFSGVKGLGHENDWGTLPVADDQYDDVRTVDHVVEFLNKRKGGNMDAPFFLACGLFRPHLPWYAPKKYFNRYPLDGIVLPKIRASDLDDLPAEGLKFAKARRGDFETIRGAGKWKHAIHAYLASITYADDQLGRVLDALDESPHSKNTIVVLWSDHGWHLGEKQHWQKTTLWEEATRVPLIISAPGITPGSCPSPVSLLDIYPTLNELAGLAKIESHDGISLSPLLNNPNVDWKRPAVIEFQLGNAAVRSKRYRYIRYRDGGEELYDHQRDPYEWTNLAASEDHTAIKSELAGWIAEKWAEPAPTKSAFRFDPKTFTWTHNKTGKTTYGKTP